MNIINIRMEIFWENNKPAANNNEYYRFNRVNWFSSIDYMIKDKLEQHIKSKEQKATTGNSILLFLQVHYFALIYFLRVKL